ncbi:hypothetical protein HMPREF1531_00152 [Propionibacterium sp. oral taxon 192 str. F0372]|uniref:TetR/AcrR family transcriptional regulator n=1 Tax=Propionibacterium sp. oral taxon 192 TaxID=671222 RepID=UPI000353FB12|nr:hypothetical protein [Propionibacterium sp. oral taxon 192]EPH07103.1 hypothetical protein HMPREF1531_00152 [Propionibacterium sp. oral taxon 192 str. F0372]
MTRPGRPTGPKPGFSRHQVVETALELGIADFTLACVASRLGVATSALYRTITSRDDLLRACLEELASRIDFIADPADWRRTVRAQAECLWVLLETNPGLDRVLQMLPWAAECFATTIGAAYQALVEAGVGEHDAALMVDMVADTTIATHLGIVAMRRRPVDDAAPEPMFSSLPRPFHAEQSWTDRGWLDRKIDLIIDGLSTRINS